MSANRPPSSPIESSAQRIELSWSSQHLALRDSREDWTGISSPTKRRKLQNRLNQRARRERARERNPQEAPAIVYRSTSQGHAPANVTSNPGSPAELRSLQGLRGSTALASKRPRPQECMASDPEVRALMNRFAEHAYASYMQGAPAVAHLPLFIKYNVATALAANAALLGVTEDFYKWEGISPINKQGPLLGLTFHDQFADWPATLQPTELQLSMEHHPWIDCFLWPQLGDNLLRAFKHPETCDEDELCRDISDYKGTERCPMLIIWGSPCDPRSWEVSDEFLKKWAWLLKGCGDVIIATNHWRAQRGEESIAPQQFANWVELSVPKYLSLSGT